MPGKLADCSRESADGTELFLVEGDSAAVPPSRRATARPRRCSPLRGKILNVASASTEKLRQNQELKDLIEALGCGVGDRLRHRAGCATAASSS